jgi:RNA polymerase sigma factor (sigma-70 family)
MRTDDPTLVPAILSGDVRRFGEVVERHDRTVRDVVERAVRDPVLREELIQQTYWLAFRSLSGVAAPERLEAWIARIARNAVVDALRRRATRRAHERPLDDLDLPERDREQPGWIWDEVARLAASEREVLALRYREGLSYREIAERIGVPCSTVRGRIYEARRALRRRLERLEERS